VSMTSARIVTWGGIRLCRIGAGIKNKVCNLPTIDPVLELGSSAHMYSP